MNWMDIFIIFILVENILKGIFQGFVRTIFNLVEFILCIYITKIYYPSVYKFILSKPKLYNGVKKFFDGIIKFLFFNKDKYDNGIVPNVVYDKISQVLITLLCIILLYFLVKIILNFIFGFISFLIRTPILKELDGLLGFLFGIVKGIIVIYIVFIFIDLIIYISPEGFIAKGVMNSTLSGYFYNNSLILDLFNIKKFIL